MYKIKYQARWQLSSSCNHRLQLPLPVFTSMLGLSSTPNDYHILTIGWEYEMCMSTIVRVSGKSNQHQYQPKKNRLSCDLGIHRCISPDLRLGSGNTELLKDAKVHLDEILHRRSYVVVSHKSKLTHIWWSTLGLKGSGDFDDSFVHFNGERWEGLGGRWIRRIYWPLICCLKVARERGAMVVIV